MQRIIFEMMVAKFMPSNRTNLPFFAKQKSAIAKPNKIIYKNIFLERLRQLLIFSIFSTVSSNETNIIKLQLLQEKQRLTVGYKFSKHTLNPQPYIIF